MATKRTGSSPRSLFCQTVIALINIVLTSARSTEGIQTSIFAATLLFAASISTGCVKERLTECYVTIIPDWSKRMDGIEPPGSYTLLVDDYTAVSDAPSHTLKHRFLPATYPVWIHNNVDHLDIRGTSVSVDAVTGMRIHNVPGWLFTCSTKIYIGGGRQTVIVPMRQQVRQLTLTLSPQGDKFESIFSIRGVMSGVAGTLDCLTGLHGTPSRTTLDFEKITFGDGAGKWRAVVRLLGVVPSPSRQRIELTVSLADPATRVSRNIEWSSDLTEQLSGFNFGKDIPLTLDGVMSPDAVGPNFTGTITEWTSNFSGTLTAQ